MIDLSNNNGTGHDFQRVHASGQRRVFFKATEGGTFNDRDFHTEGAQAAHAGMRVGAYHFAHGTLSPAEEFHHFATALHGLAFVLRLRPALDLEYAAASSKLGRWALEWLGICRHELGVDAIVYGNGPFLQACQFGSTPAGLWLASYGRDDGVEHPYLVPRPWKLAAAHQFSSQALVPGIRGRCDVSHVYLASAIDWPGR